jgi:endonuclease-3
MAETLEAKRARAQAIIRALDREFPEVASALHFTTPFELLIATILAAQCTDAQVNKVTPALFRAFPTPQAVVDAPTEDLERLIHSTGFFRAKARSVKACCASLVEKFGGEVPQTIDELITLKGVGRKTANVVIGNAFHMPGIAVDTHVKRITGLLRLTSSDDPTKIELDLQKVLPEESWTGWSHRIAMLGRAVCIARRPKCSVCAISSFCPSKNIV